MVVSVELPDSGAFEIPDPLPVRRYRPNGGPGSRVAYAAAHVVADPRADNTPGAPPVLDWDATISFRRHLWGLGLGVADAMDTAQRGMGLDWVTAAELIRRTGAAAADCGGALVCGAGADRCGAPAASLTEIVDAYSEQIDVIERAGARVVVMASRELAATATGAQDYHSVYSAVLDHVSRPAILHWLGPMFDPRMAGYWGSDDLDIASATVLALIRSHADKVDGIKVSLLDASRERALRRELPAGVRLYTGDDFHYPDLIAGDGEFASDALLGIFDPIAPAAAGALSALADGDLAAYQQMLGPTVALARHCFAAPTSRYKTGVVFLAWLSGHQSHFTMVDGQQSARSVRHLLRLFELAAAARVLPDPDLAAARIRALLATSGWQR